MVKVKLSIQAEYDTNDLIDKVVDASYIGELLDRIEKKLIEDCAVRHPTQDKHIQAMRELNDFYQRMVKKAS